MLVALDLTKCLASRDPSSALLYARRVKEVAAMDGAQSNFNNISALELQRRATMCASQCLAALGNWSEAADSFAALGELYRDENPEELEKFYKLATVCRERSGVQANAGEEQRSNAVSTASPSVATVTAKPSTKVNLATPSKWKVVPIVATAAACVVLFSVLKKR